MSEAAAADSEFGLPPHALARIRETLKGFSEIHKAILYGSRAKGTHRHASDIDVTLVAPEMNWQRFLDLERALDDLLLPWKMDLSLYHQIDNDDLLRHIEQVGVNFLPGGRRPSGDGESS